MSLSRAVEFTDDHPGSIVLICGPMFAGKSTELMRRVKRELFAMRRCCVIKYAKDTRYSCDKVATHDNQQITSTVQVSQLSELGERWKNYDVIAIDEGQFFPDIVTFSQTAADSGIKVIISALDGDFQRKPFGKVAELMPLCDNIIKVTAVCMKCQRREAPFTKRIVRSNEQELIGGADMYAAVCRQCYLDGAPPTPGKVTRYRMACDRIQGKMPLSMSRDNEQVILSPQIKRTRPESAFASPPLSQLATMSSPVTAGAPAELA